MPAFLLAAFQTYVLPKLIDYVISKAVEHKMLPYLEGALIKFGLSLKTYQEYPGDNTNPPATTNIAPITDDELDRQFGKSIRGQYPTGKNGT